MNIITSNTILYCNRWKETVAFYVLDLKLTVLLDKKWFVELKLTDSARLSIADAAKSSIKSSNGRGITISMAVDDIEQTRLTFLKRKLAPTNIKSCWGSSVFYLYDPEGNRLEFWS
ncbi:MAG: VOC family protein [Desulfobacterium sp.]